MELKEKLKYKKFDSIFRDNMIRVWLSLCVLKFGEFSVCLFCVCIAKNIFYIEIQQKKSIILDQIIFICYFLAINFLLMFKWITNKLIWINLYLTKEISIMHIANWKLITESLLQLLCIPKITKMWKRTLRICMQIMSPSTIIIRFPWWNFITARFA